MSTSTSTVGHRTKGPVVVFGTGLLGASIGLGLRNLGVEVYLDDPSPSALAVAVDLGAGRPLREHPGIWPEVVVVACPADVTATVVADALRRFPGAVVTDVASVKGSIVAELVQLADEHSVDVARYLGSHPMAGRERSGAVSARGELFQAAPWVVCPHESSTEHAQRVVENLALDLGAVVRVFDPVEHDDAVALVSHVPQLVSTLLAATLNGASEQELSLAGNGLRDTTRIAASHESMWVPILKLNSGAIAEVLHGLHEELIKVLTALDNPAVPGASLQLASTMAAGNTGQARIPGKHGGSAQSFSWVSVLVDDTPGQLAKLLTEIGEAGINLEDMHLDHSSGLNAGVAEISVLPQARDTLITELDARGWRVLQ